MIQFGRSNKEEHLQAILDLQAINLAPNLSMEERQEQGFVTCHHNLELLKRMNQPYPHVIAMEEEHLAGYCLVMLKELRNEIDILVPMFDQIEAQNLPNGRSLASFNYFVMGQVCVAKEYRGRAVFSGLYHHMREVMSGHFEMIITEISQYNTRSLRAHDKVGFKKLHEYVAPDGHPWVLVYWDWS